MQSSPDTPVRIDGDRLWSRLMALAEVGAYAAHSGLQGVNRLALTDADSAGRHLVVGWMREAGLEVRIDAMGNVFGRREGTEPSAAPVMSASHIDSVATAGAFDGCLGVLAALEAVETFDALEVTTRRPIDIGFFTEEEGVRFGTDMLGSAVACGRIPVEQAHALTDADGHTLADELARTGWDGTHPAHLDPPHAYVELHIEQGPVLASEGLTLGVVTGVQGISWQEVTIEGRSAHAGTTPTELRIDAALAAARVITHVQELVDSGRFGGLRGTVGQLALAPGLTNVVAHRAVLTVDLRNPDDEALTAAEGELTAYLRGLEATQPGLTIRTRRMARTAPVAFDEGVQKVIAQAIEDLGHDYRHLISGAGHDAQEVAAIAPPAMVFVRGEHDGISHNPREWSTPEACAAGADVLATVLHRLAMED